MVERPPGHIHLLRLRSGRNDPLPRRTHHPDRAAQQIVDIATDGWGVVTKLGRSPLPGDHRCCAYLLPCPHAILQSAVAPQLLDCP
jgi:hypothetical protein